jgi:hypothetical protein
LGFVEATLHVGIITATKKGTTKSKNIIISESISIIGIKIIDEFRFELPRKRELKSGALKI